MRVIRASPPRLALAALCLLTALLGCAGRRQVESVAPPLVAGVGEERVEGSAGVPCDDWDVATRRRAADAAVVNAVERAAAAYGNISSRTSVPDLVAAHRVQRYWQSTGLCFASVEAIVRTAKLTAVTRDDTRRELGRLGRPELAFAVQSYRILPNTAYVTRRSAAEVIDSLQQEFVSRGFDVRRSHAARSMALKSGGSEVRDISSLEREQIARAARLGDVAFLVQGEIKVTDEGRDADGSYLAVVDGSLEAVELRTDRVVGAFRDVATAKHVSASAAYTKAISGFARAASAALAPQMLDTWEHDGF